MLTKDSINKDILDYPISGTTVRQAGSISFMSWVASKLDGVQTYKAATQELLLMVRSVPMGKMPDEEKINIVRKLMSIDVIL